MKKIFILLIFFTMTLSLAAEKVVLAELNRSIISPVSVKYVKRALQQAENEKAAAFILKLNTPGGLLSSTREIVSLFLNSRIPVIVYVSPAGGRATSAGMFIALAADIVVMNPATHIGAAHPVMLNITGRKRTEKDSSDSRNILREKILSDTLAFARNISEKRERDFNPVKDAIINSVSYTATEALEKKLADFLADDLQELLGKTDSVEVSSGDQQNTLSLKGAEILEVEMHFAENLISSLTSPNIAYILMLLGIIGLIFEVSHPGIGFPGIAGAIFLLLAFMAFDALSINMAGILLVFLALLLFIAELFTPTFGLFTFGGTLALIAGSLILYEQTAPLLLISLKLLIIMSILVASLCLFFAFHALKFQRRKAVSGKDALIGEEAVILLKKKDSYRIALCGESWLAFSEEDLQQGERVIVTGYSDKLSLKIEKLKDHEGEESC